MLNGSESLEESIARKVAEKPQRLYDSVEHWIHSETGGVVQSGPFKGMLMMDHQAWKDGNLSSKCLGCYEEELHPFFEEQIKRLSLMERPKIVDLGCAEGYYSIGMARRLPNAEVFGVDISEDCVAILKQAAERNGVVVRTGAPVAEVMTDPDLVICDVEGDEDCYLSLKSFPSLAHADIVVECHDYDLVSYTKSLTELFSDTHDVQNVTEGPRDPNKYQILRRQQSIHRWMAVCEGRPCTMNWLLMRVKTSGC